MALVVFNGTVMRDQPAHANLEGATFLEDVRTAAAYRLWTISDRHPAMMRAEEGGSEVYEVPDDVWPRIRDTEPRGLYRGSVELSDGRHVEGMLGEQSLIDGPDALEITEFGGWRAYLGSKR